MTGKCCSISARCSLFGPIIKEIRYSLNSDRLDQVFKFKPSDKMYEIGDELPYLAVPKHSE